MSKLQDVFVPDIGGAEGVEVIEILIKEGDHIHAEDALMTLESEKATMDVPSPVEGIVKAIKVKVGDKVSEGHLIIQLAEAQADEKKPTPLESSQAQPTAEPIQKKTDEKVTSASEKAQPITLPDLGTEDAVEVIEVHVKVGDRVAAEQPLMTLESEKATMDVPAPQAGKITAWSIKVGDKVSSGAVVGEIISTAGESTATSPAKSQAAPATPPKAAPVAAASPSAAPKAPADKQTESLRPDEASDDLHAGPGVRRLAHDLGIALTMLQGSGRKGRILREDVVAFAKKGMQAGGSGATGLSLAEAPRVDFSKFGEVETQALSRIKKLSGKFLHRNWVTIPHVTQFDEADMTALEAFRMENKALAEKAGAKLTPLVFLLKAVVGALKAYPQFNASLDDRGENLILKKYFHIGVAVDTPNGLLVPVVRDVDQKGFIELAQSLAELSAKARAGKLTPSDMQGGCFSISSLGGIGGTAFTPIINAPEVAILGVSRAEMKPKFVAGEFVPRLMLPLSLSYDHRVIDGADAARFTVYLANALADMRRLLL